MNYGQPTENSFWFPFMLFFLFHFISFHWLFFPIYFSLRRRYSGNLLMHSMNSGGGGRGGKKERKRKKERKAERKKEKGHISLAFWFYFISLFFFVFFFFIIFLLSLSLSLSSSWGKKNVVWGKLRMHFVVMWTLTWNIASEPHRIWMSQWESESRGPPSQWG